jgi:tRNA threonylcarbamoyladenosine biosynthesis protein TsaE
VIVDEAALAEWGEQVGRGIARPAFFALRGPLGAGKSVLARAIARGAGVHSTMPSPTYNLVLRYDLPDGAVLHLDLYRLESADEAWALGWQELGGAGELALVEWPGRAEPLLPADRWEVSLEAGPGPGLRRLEVHAVGSPPPLPGPAASALAARMESQG